MCTCTIFHSLAMNGRPLVFNRLAAAAKYFWAQIKTVTPLSKWVNHNLGLATRRCSNPSSSKVLAKYLDNAVACDAFLSLLRSCKDHKRKLVELTGALLATFELESCSDRLRVMPEPLQEAGERLAKICRAVNCLCCPIPSGLGSSPADVDWVLKYKDSNPLVLYVQGIFQESDIWSKLWDEVLAKHAATAAMWSEVQRLQDELKARPVHKPALTSAIAKLAGFKKAARAGALEEFELELCRCLLAAAQDMIDTEGKDCTMAFFIEVQKGLGMFQDAKAFSLCSQLAKLQVKVGQNLLLADMVAVLQEYPQECAMELGHVDVSKKLDVLLKALNHSFKTAITLPPEVMDKIASAIFWHFRSLYFELREPCWKVVSLLNPL